MSTPSGNVFQDSTNLVFDGWNFYRDLGNSWVQQTQNAISDLDQVYVEPISISVDYNVGTFAPTFTRPPRPDDLDPSPVTPVTPDDPTLDPIVMRELGDAPAEPDLAPYTGLAMPNTPSEPVPTAPLIDTTLDEIVVPERRAYTAPELPELYALTLPEAEPITLPEFDGVRPDFDLDAPVDGQLEWAEQAYQSDLQDAVKAALQDMLQGGLGLPIAVEQAIFDRGRAREDRLSRRQIAEVEEDMASRGLSEPNGILAKRLREVHADNREKTHALNRDLSIERFKEAVEQMRFAVTNGIALEQTLIQQSLAINDRALKAAMFVREYGINRYNALINYHNLQQSAYATDAQVWKQRIEGELSKLEKLRAEIEVQKLTGEINKDLLAQFNAQWEAIKIESDAYLSEVQAAKVKGERNAQRLEAGRLLLQQYDTKVNAWGKLWDGYRSQIEGALGRGKFAESLANIYATQMRGYQLKGESFFNEGRFALDKNAQTIELFRAQLQRSDQDLRAQLAVLDGDLRTFASRVDMYQADGVLAQAESAAYDRAAQLKAEIERNRTAVAVQAAQMRLDQVIKTAEILVEQVKAKAQALSNLAASSQAGVSLAASINASGSASYSHSRSVGWSGEAADFTGVEVFY